MANVFKGDWQIKVMQQIKGGTTFLSDGDKFTVASYSGNDFSFVFKIGSSDHPSQMTEGANETFTGSFTHNGINYSVKARKFSVTHTSTGPVSVSFTCTYLVGAIGTPDLSFAPHDPFDPTDVISFTAVKTD